MELSRARAPPSVRIHESPETPDNRPTSLRSPSYHTSTLQTSSRPMSVPNAPQNEPPPPPLPPPRHIPELAAGFDPGWGWANSKDGGDHSATTLPPIRQGSSLLQGNPLHQMADARSTSEKSEDDEMDIDVVDRRGSSVSTLRSLSGLQASMSSMDAGVDSTSYGASYHLQSERPLEQQSLKASSHQYDRDLLSKFGRPATLATFHSNSRSDSVPSARSVFPRNIQPRSHSSIEFPPSLGDHSPLRQVNTSLGTSPSTYPVWREYTGFVGTPSSATTAPSSASDVEQWQQSRLHRDSYDQAIPPDADIDFHQEDSKAFRLLHIGDHEHGEINQRLSGQGHKRRRRSGSRDQMQDVTPSCSLSASADSAQRSYSTALYPRSPHEQLQSHHGSISSVSSAGPRHGSYASSAGMSVARSSITSVSTFDRSPGGLSPRPDIDGMTDSSYSYSANFPQNVSSLPTRTLKPATSVDSKTSTSLPAKATAPSAGAPRVKGTSSKSSGAFLCTCCPKKPKRFATADELRQHTTEKHYECAYCGNRFKNKNEAERHQNSLHLRRHSWSCAAIAGPEAAFHPTSAGSGSSPVPATMDACGYCGQEFPNGPRLDWAARKEHLLIVHKFGECNKAKKFFRADHFRQHLKHSHAGSSGKWTNLLENACMKDEPPLDEATSPGAEEGVGLTPASLGESVSTHDDENND